MPPTAPSHYPRLNTLTRARIVHHLDRYPSALAAKASSSQRSDSSLIELDAWYQSLPHLTCPSDLFSSISTKEDLVKLMRWKLAREKHRPTLLLLISSNPAPLCDSTLHRAATHLLSHHLTARSSTDQLLSAVESTMKILAELRGVGPATSSAIVACWCEFGVFQSDELVMNLFEPLSRIDYSWGFYKRFYREAVGVLRELKANGKVESGREMERVAWSMFYGGDEGAGGDGDGEERKDEGREGKVLAKEPNGKSDEKMNGGTTETKVKRKTLSKTKVDVEDEAEAEAQVAKRRSKRVRRQ